jgi:transcriptional regulator with XRE-family HTH domain
MTKFSEFMDRYQISQYRLHKLSGFSKSQISEWQRGIHLPSLKSARRLAIALKLSIHTVKDQLVLRENCQNDIDESGAFVPRRKKNRPSTVQTNDPARTAEVYCLLCRQRMDSTAPTLGKAA